MSDFAGDKVFRETVYLVETTDLVLGGSGSATNRPIRDLADRTAWLRNSMKGYAGITMVSASRLLSQEDVLFKLVVINSNFESIECTLPLLEAADAGVRISITAFNVIKQVSIKSSGFNDIVLGSFNRQQLFMGNGDGLELIWLGAAWMVLESKGNFFDVGAFQYGYSQLPNTIIADGTILNRSEFPRLWEYASGLQGSLVADYTWTTGAGYKGFFSSGNSVTTFRVPDLRSMFIRGLDLGAGITYGRNSDNAGGYEADELKSHSHNITMPSRDLKDDSANGPDITREGPDRRSFTTDATGGTETRPKNIGLIPLIKI
jgi:hypothetical protein